MSNILRTVDIHIGGEDRKLKFTVGSLEELEANIPGHNVMELMQRSQFSVGELVTAAWVGLKYYNKKLMRKDVREWVDTYMAEHDGGDLFQKVYAAIGLSGLFGKDVSIFEDIIAIADNTESDEETGKQESNPGV